MSLKILIDMNLSPQWVEVFKRRKIEAKHWSKVGDPRADDRVIMDWARENGYIVFTHDLDFGTILALTKAQAPSVIQMRTENVLPEYFSKTLISVVKKYKTHLHKGAIIVLDDMTHRLRILPLG